MSEPIFDPAAIFTYALEHAKEGRAELERSAMAKKVQGIFLCSVATINKWASQNDSTKRRNPIEACGELFKLFFTSCRPAAFQVQSYFKELELRLMSEPLSHVGSFQPRELIHDLRQALRIVEDLEARRAVPGEYRAVISELQGLASEHGQRIIQGNIVVEPEAKAFLSSAIDMHTPMQEPATVRKYNPATWLGNRRSG